MALSDGFDQIFTVGKYTIQLNDSRVPTGILGMGAAPGTTPQTWQTLYTVMGVSRSLKGLERNVGDDPKTIVSHYLYFLPTTLQGTTPVIERGYIAIPVDGYDPETMQNLPRFEILYHTLKRELFYYIQAKEIHDV